jgi:hypothetical protein
MVTATGHHYLSRRLGPVAACGVLAMLVVAGVGSPGALGAPTPRASHPSATGPLALDAPSGLAVYAGNLWVTNLDANSVTEINPSTHLRIMTVDTTSDAFQSPDAITAMGSDLFIANRTGAGGLGSVTEINASTGAWVRTVSTGDGFDHPVAFAWRENDLFVANQGGSITELNSNSGALIRQISGYWYDFANPAAMTVTGTYLWVANDSTANTVTEVSATTGALIKTITGQGLSSPDGIGYGEGNLWVADSTSYAATEINATDGDVVRTVSDSTGPYGFNDPSVTIVNGGNVYVVSPPGDTPMITKFSATDGTAAWFECNTNSPSPNFVLPVALAMIGTDLFVANEDTSTTTLDGNGQLVGDSITELSVSDGGNAVAWMTNSTL